MDTLTVISLKKMGAETPPDFTKIKSNSNLSVGQSFTLKSQLHYDSCYCCNEVSTGAQLKLGQSSISTDNVYFLPPKIKTSPIPQKKNPKSLPISLVL